MSNQTGPQLFVRTKTWIENEEGELLFGKGKTEILELIEQEGSIATGKHDVDVKGLAFSQPP